MKNFRALCGAVAAVILAANGGRALGAFAYTPGDLVVLQVGLTGNPTTLTSAGTASQLDEFTTGGAGVSNSTVFLPTALAGANNPLTISGTAGSEGSLNLSSNGQFLVVGGYDVGVGGTTQGTSTIGLIDPSGVVNTSTTTTQLSGNNTRSATSVDGTEVWVAGAAGIVAETTGNSSGTIIATRNIRAISAVSGSVSPSGSNQLFISSNKSTLGISTVGAGTPTAGTAPVTILPGMTTPTAPDSFGFFFANSTTLFVADGDDGIQEWTLSGGSWSSAAALAGSYTALTGSVSGGIVNLYAISGNASGWTVDDSLVSDTFNLSATTFGTPTTLATATGNTGFSGVALAPTAVPEPTALGSLVFGAAALLGRRRRRGC